MQAVSILKRKDGSSIIAGVVLALISWQAVQAWSLRPANWLSGNNSQGGGWRAGFWTPLVTLVVELVVFELLVRAYIMLAQSQKPGRK